MGNATVTPTAPATSFTPNTAATYRNYPTSDFVINPDTSAVSTTINTFSTSVIPISSSIPAIPVISPTLVVPVTSPTLVAPASSPILTVPITSRISAIPEIAPTHAITVTYPTPAFSVHSPTLAFSAQSPTHVFPVHSPIPAFPVHPPTHVFPVHSHTPAIPVTFPIPTTTNIPVNYFNFTPVVSPDSSAVSPTIDLPPSLVTSPIPLKSTTPVNVIRSTARINNNTFTSPTTPLASSTNGIPVTPLPTEVTPKRPISKISTTSPISNAEQKKTNILSSADRWQKWNKFEEKQRDQQKHLFHTDQQAKSLDTSTPPTSTITDEDQKEIPLIQHIVAVPSFQLRTTAVSSLPQHDRVLLERTQSIHTNTSIFKYYQTKNESNLTIGNHTKATMFKMNTRLKQTPLPTPSLLLITRNFNDGTSRTEDNSTMVPTFVSLGLQHDLEFEPIEQSLTQFHVKQQEQQKILHSSASLDSNSSSDNSLYDTSSRTVIQPNYSTIERTSVRHQPASILKKSTSQIINNPYSMQTKRNVFEELQKTDFENHPSTVSFHIPSRSTKASQSILRSENLFSSRSARRKK